MAGTKGIKKLLKIIPTTHDDEYSKSDECIGTDVNYKRKVLWMPFALTMAIIHVCGAYGFYLCAFKCRWATAIYALVIEDLTTISVTAGVHRLFAHRTYKANTVVKMMYAILFTMSGQFSLYKWVLNHRQHHKFTDTDADPHNSKQGFFFCHMGWLILSPHPTMIEKRKTIDMSDLDNDAIVMFQKRNYFLLFFIFSFILPVSTSMYFFNETFWNASFVTFWFRWMVSLHIIWCVNSVTHIWGSKPYDKHIKPTQIRWVSSIACGEGWHNYHHSFPWDYRTAESDIMYIFNRATFFIDLLASFGWAYDLKITSENMMRKIIEKTGDGSHRFVKELEKFK